MKVIDFGIGRVLTEKTSGQRGSGGWVRGTPASMSPEQRAGRDELIDARSDIYGMGLLFAELFLSQSAWRGGGCRVFEEQEGREQEWFAPANTQCHGRPQKISVQS